MDACEVIISLIENTKLLYRPVEKNSNLYFDLDFDSLELIQLLLKVEETFCIRLSLMEMDQCIQMDQLIKIVERKIEEGLDGQEFITESKK